MSTKDHKSYHSSKNQQLDIHLEYLLDRDPYLIPFKDILQRRLAKILETEKRLTRAKITLADFACGHEYYGLHFQDGRWILREWAPHANGIYLIGEMTGWQEIEEYKFQPLKENGQWEIRLPAETLRHNDLYRLRVHWPGGRGDRIPSYARRVAQDEITKIFNAQVWHPQPEYQWQCPDFRRTDEIPFIYEVHVGMAQAEEKIGSYREFSEYTLPRVVAAGYNTLQLMAIQEHPYYGSFGYQVSNFFAASSRYGTPDELKALVDAAHCACLAVFMDIIHSHAV